MALHRLQKPFTNQSMPVKSRLHHKVASAKELNKARALVIDFWSCTIQSRNCRRRIKPSCDFQRGCVVCFEHMIGTSNVRRILNRDLTFTLSYLRA